MLRRVKLFFMNKGATVGPFFYVESGGDYPLWHSAISAVELHLM